MKVCIEYRSRISAPDCRCAIFPGGTRLKDGSLLLLFVAGDSFESADQHVVKARSFDNGQNWIFEGNLYDHSSLPFSMPFSDCCKPTLLENGEIIATGYGYIRDLPEMGLSDYAEKYGRFPEVRNFLIHSCDNGQTWNGPEFIHHRYDGLELSGPALAIHNKKLLIFAPPFTIDPQKQRGLCFACEFGVTQWREIGVFFDKPGVAPWEVRSCQLASGRIVLVIWAYDLIRQQHLNNQLVFSDDNGKTWSQPLDIGLPGQASNLAAIGNKMYLVQTRREGSECGIYLHRLELNRDSVSIKESCCLMNANNLASDTGRIEKQFQSLKFGQPSLIYISENKYLLLFWRADENSYWIESWGFKIS